MHGKNRQMISAVCVGYNGIETAEEAITRILPFVDEFIVIDQGSTDGTSEILKQYTTNYEKVENKGFCEYHREYVISKTKGDWILWLDLDEYWDEKTMKFIVEFSKQKEYDELRFKRITFTNLKMIQEEDSIAPRFWRKEGITYKPVIHSQPIGLKRHLTRNDLVIIHQQGTVEKIFNKLNKYDEVCDDLVEQGLIDKGTSDNLKSLAEHARNRVGGM